ncbi:hypothetical protein [Gluconacetobacter liquefaciens]|nr:hypothetical protein [Gluconacetobacter liquefaciens]MBB2188342.1 hypothetical protein [Gluconacetobacter liquefaciens]
MITYDLHKPGDSGYNAIYEYIKGYEHRHPVESVWFIDTLKSPKEIRDEMESILPYPENDRLIVIRQKKSGWATFRTPILAKWFNDDSRTWDK